MIKYYKTWLNMIKWKFLGMKKVDKNFLVCVSSIRNDGVNTFFTIIFCLRFFKFTNFHSYSIIHIY